MGACLVPSYSPDGAAGEHKFTAPKPVFILDGLEGCVMYDVCFSGNVTGIWMWIFLKKMTRR